MMCINDINMSDVMSDNCIQKAQYSYHRVDYMSLHCKEYHTRHLYLM